MDERKKAFFLACFILLFSNSVSAAGLQNSGFENALTHWAIDSQAEVVTVTGTEGAADSGTYADLGIVVNPYLGSQMLRLGGPKLVKESQNRGANTVTQEFISTHASQTFSFRLFSWEHRGDDVFRFDVRDALGNSFSLSTPLTITFPRGPAQTCDATPCEFVIDVGKRGDFLDSGWTEVKVTGLPTDDSAITVEYSVIGGQNEAHATWAYFDNANTPPVAKFSFTDADITEGDPVTFTDESYDPDPGDKIESWEWTVAGPEFDETIIVDDQSPIFIFPEEGSFIVTLTVTDSYGASTSVSSGGMTLDQVLIDDLEVLNESVLMSVLNQEALVGQGVELFGRFIDPGFLDAHTASWDVDGFVEANVQEENIPAIASGIVTGTMLTPAVLGDISGMLSIEDDDGAPASTSFTLRVLDVDFDRREPNNSIGSAPVLESGWVYLSAIENVGDVDVFEIVGPEGVALAANGEVLVKLKNLPADYDLVLLSQLPAGASTTPWTRSPWTRSPWTRSPWTRSPWTRSPWTRSPWTRSPWTRSPWTRSPWTRSPWTRSPWTRSCIDCDPFITFDQFPLSELAYVDTGSSDIGNGDIEISELGLDPSDLDGLTVVGFSSNRGLEDEELLVRTDFAGTRIFAVIVGANGMANPDEPYSLQVETSRPLDLEPIIGDACNGVPVVTGTAVTPSTTTLFSAGAGAKTLIVTQMARMQSLNNMDAATYQALNDQLVLLASHPSVQGDIISLPSTIYDAWDSNPCNVGKVNDVTDAIRSELMNLYSANPNIENIVFVGNDFIVPHRRVPDETVISNERLYSQESFLAPGSPLFSSVYGGNNLTDDFYVDTTPSAWQGRHLYVPDYAIGRLVETPAEIMSMIQAFLVNGGNLAISTALVMGYDFFSDGSQLTASYLGGGSDDITSLIDEVWTADDMRCGLLGQDSETLSGCAVHDISSFNAHFNHFGALSANGFNTNNYDDFMSSTDVALAGNGVPVLENTLNFTLGCHAGLNVPDGSSLPVDFGPGVDTDLDFAQAMSRQKGMYIGSTGYGLGDDEGIAGTERLLAMFAEEIVKGGSVGRALLTAKNQFVNSLSTMTVYDEKSTIQTILYGLPMMNVEPSGSRISNPPVSPFPSTQAGTTLLTIIDNGQNTTSTHSLEKVSVSTGEFYVSSGDHQATAWRPIQPKIVLDVTGLEPVHGMVVTGGSYYDEEPFDPVISRPTQEWEVNATEESICINAFWPSIPVTLNALENADEQTMIVSPGQFRCTSGQADNVTGVQRIFTEMSVEVNRSSSLDFKGPTISEVDFRSNDDGSLTINVDTNDDSGVSRIVLLLVKDGQVVSTSYDNLVAGAGSYSLDIPNFIDDTRVVIQVVDGVGNVSAWSGKGVNVRVIEVDAGDSSLFSLQSPASLKGTVPAFTDLLTKSASVFYRWAFGDGTYAFGRLAKDGEAEDFVTVETDGSAWFKVDHQYTSELNKIAELKVTDAFGGVGIDDVEMVFCGDAADLPGFDPSLDFTGCDVQNSSPTEASIFLTVNGLISETVQYRLHLDIKSGPRNPVPDGKEDLMLKYHGGSFTGLKSLYVEKVGPQTLRFDFDLSEVKWKGSYFDWYAETQDGVSGAPNAGFIDVMPDQGMFRYVIK